jgi:uncharacterized membrane protein YgcG
MKTKLLSAFLLTISFLLFAGPANAIPVPSAFPAVVDNAGILSDSEEKLIQKELDDLVDQTSHPAAVLTVKNMDGASIEDFTIATARAWGIGAKTGSDGLLLVIAMDERALRLEVGDGIANLITLDKASQVVDDIIAPKLTDREYASAIIAGFAEIGAIFEEAAGTTELPAVVEEVEAPTDMVIVYFFGTMAVLILIGLSIVVANIVLIKKAQRTQAKIAWKAAEDEEIRKLHAERMNRKQMEDQEFKKFKKTMEVIAADEQASIKKESDALYKTLNTQTKNKLKSIPSKSTREAILKKAVQEERAKGLLPTSNHDDTSLILFMLYSGVIGSPTVADHSATRTEHHSYASDLHSGYSHDSGSSSSSFSSDMSSGFSGGGDSGSF